MTVLSKNSSEVFGLSKLLLIYESLIIYSVNTVG